MDKGTLLDVKASIRSLIMSTSDSMTIQDLQKDFKKFVGYPLPYTSLGYRNAEQLLRAMPDVVQLSDYGPQALVYYVPNKKTEHIADLVRNQRQTTNKRRKRDNQQIRRRSYTMYPVDMCMSEESPEEVSAFERLDINDIKSSPKTNKTWNNAITEESIIEATKYLISAHQEVEIKNQSRKRFNVTISSSYGTDNDNTTVEPYKKLNSTLPTELTTKSIRSVVRFGSRYYPIEEIKNSSEDAVPQDAVTEIITNMEDGQIKINKEPIQQHSQIPECKLYEELEKGSVISLYISEIHSPLIFHFHIHKEDHELLKLETQLKETYSKLEFNDLILMDSYLLPGKYCAAKNDANWYRAKILAVPTYLNNFSKIRLLFIDYGCISYVPVRRLKLLAPIFFSIPIQVACGRLFQLRSNEITRSSEAIRFFASLVNDRCLYAYIGNVNKNPPLLLDMILIDTSVQPKRNINEILVKKGFAERKKP